MSLLWWGCGSAGRVDPRWTGEFAVWFPEQATCVFEQGNEPPAAPSASWVWANGKICPYSCNALWVPIGRKALHENKTIYHLTGAPVLLQNPYMLCDCWYWEHCHQGLPRYKIKQGLQNICSLSGEKKAKQLCNIFKKPKKVVCFCYIYNRSLSSGRCWSQSASWWITTAWGATAVIILMCLARSRLWTHKHPQTLVTCTPWWQQPSPAGCSYETRFITVAATLNQKLIGEYNMKMPVFHTAGMM